MSASIDKISTGVALATEGCTDAVRNTYGAAKQSLLDMAASQRAQRAKAAAKANAKPLLVGGIAGAVVALIVS